MRNRRRKMIRVHFQIDFLVLLAAMAVGLSSTTFAQGDFESVASGAWNSSSTWQLVSGSEPNGIPDANHNVTIKNGDTITVGGGTRDCANLVIDAGGTLWIDGIRHMPFDHDKIHRGDTRLRNTFGVQSAWSGDSDAV